MKKINPNAGNPNVPDYKTLKEIIVKGTESGGDMKQYAFTDKNKVEQTRTFNQTWREICGIGTYFHSLGLEKGAKIAIIAENSFDWMVAYYATLMGGYITVPMDCKLSAEYLSDQLIRCGCDALIYSDNFDSMIEQFKADPDMPVKHYLAIDEFENYRQIGYKLFDEGDTYIVDAEVKPDDLACIVYTSGTTAKSKGVMLTHYNIASNCTASTRVISGRHAIGFLPLNHTYAWVSALFACYILNEWGYLCESIKTIQSDMKKQKPYNLSGVPLVVETIYNRIWRTAKSTDREEILKKGLKISRFLMKLGIDRRRKIFATIIDNLGGNLSMIVCGGANLDPKYEEGMRDFGIEVYNGYGMTECSPAITCNRPDAYKPGSVGKPLGCCEIKINNPDEEGVGEIYVRGTNVMVGYYNDPEATAEAFDGEWLKTGDHGRIDEDGFLFMIGRKKNLICLSNGKNVSPEELEDKISQSIEYVQEVLVYDENEQIIAEVFLNEEDFPDARERIKTDMKELNKNVASFKRINKTIVRDEEFPKTTTLKIVRKYMTPKN
ncbi:MAG: AMP-binding protein [Clostridia bacterium]|nr:AMP-binding protein [Clostridia bacterium]